MTTIEVFKKYESTLTRLEEKNPDQFGVFLHGIREPFSTSISSFNIEGEIPMVISKKASQMLLLTDVGIHWIISEKEEFRSWNSIADILISNQQVIIRKNYNGILIGNGSFSRSLISDSFVWNLMFKELLVAKVMSKPIKKALNPSDFVTNTESTNKNRNAITMSSNLTVDVKKNQTGSNRITKEQIESEYKWLITILSDTAKAISDINGKNEQFGKLKGSLVALVEGMVLDTMKEMENSLNFIPWDNLVIAFFGETNAGKSTIIETFRILFEQNRKQGQDGLIVGDGRQDFTKDYHEYKMSIAGKPFTLIDVPGIEGNEDDFRDVIKEALHKAHCVFYVQGHNKKPDSATAEKIKNYLGDWVNVYSIQNVRGSITNYDEPEERETLLTTDVLKNEKLIKESFQNILGNVYKGNITLQALLAMCAKASFSNKREDLQRNQEKLLKYFGNADEVLRFSQFHTIRQLVEEKASNFTDEIVEANKQKMTSLAHRSANSMENTLSCGDVNISDIEQKLKNFRLDVKQILGSAQTNLEQKVLGIVRTKLSKLKNELYGLVGQGFDALKSNGHKRAAAISSEIYAEITNAIRNEINNATRKIDNKKKELPSVSLKSNFNIRIHVNVNVDLSEALEELDLNLDKIGNFALGTAGMAATGAAIGSFIPGVGTLIGAGVGAAIGAVVSGVSGDGGKAEAKKYIAESISDAERNILSQVLYQINAVKRELNEEQRKLTSEIDKEIDNLNALSNFTSSLENNIRKFINKLNNTMYGAV